MARSKTSMCNIALRMTGDRRRIANVDDGNSEAAVICRELFEEVRDQVIIDPEVDFICARARAELAQHSSDPDFNWSYQYPLPADYLRLRRHVDDEATMGGYLYMLEGDTSSYPYTIETIASGEAYIRVMLTNKDDCFVLYIRQVEDVTLFGPNLANAICTLLAARLAMPLGAGKVKADELLTLYEQIALPRARAENQATLYQADEEGMTAWGDAGRY